MMNRYKYFSAGIVIFLCALAAQAQTRSAAEIIQSTGVKGGIIVHVGCGGGKFTAGLKINERYIVQGLDTDTANVQKARQHIKSLGLYGEVTAETFDGKNLPYADNLINLLIVEDSVNIAADEIMRVLTPRGVVCFRKDGKWRKQTKAWPDDIDEWTHFLHGPDNNAVAEDTRIKPPKHTQWVSGPQWGRSHDHLSSVSAVVSASGRIFYIIDEGPIASVNAPSDWKLVARDAFNGVLLWKKDISPWEDQLRPFRSGPAEMPRRLVAVGERVYVTLGYGKPVTALDAATGQVLSTYEGTENTHEIVAHNERLFLVISEPLEENSPTTGIVLR
ncbi:MAG: class I SAM-dependent methyltransferase, partial [Planctomycetota bacterium]